ncbi:MAG: hypothetical protein R3264_18775 [Anaerolineae bacterium]|nr:hypothetical protein [Anaerolineae bacterium]
MNQPIINHQHNTQRPTPRSPLSALRSPLSALRSPLFALRSLLPLGLFLTGLGGAFAPWIWRDSVALQLTAPGLAEFVKFLPEIRTGTLRIERLYFLLPLFLAMLALPLFAENKKLALPLWLRWSLRLSVIPFALASLSPVWTPAVLIAPEFRLQTGLASVAIGLAIIAPLLNHASLKILCLFLLIGGIAALILPIWQFSLVQASISTAYDEPVSLGWGWWLTQAGLILSIVGASWSLFFQNRDQNGNR